MLYAIHLRVNSCLFIFLIFKRKPVLFKNTSLHLKNIDIYNKNLAQAKSDFRFDFSRLIFTKLITLCFNKEATLSC